MAVKIIHSYGIISSLSHNLQDECESRRQQGKWDTQPLALVFLPLGIIPGSGEQGNIAAIQQS